MALPQQPSLAAGLVSTPVASAPAAETPPEQPFRQVYACTEAPELVFFFADGSEGQFSDGVFVCDTPEEVARMDEAISQMAGGGIIRKLDEQADAENIQQFVAGLNPQSQAVKGGMHSMSVPQVSREQRDEQLRAMEQLGMPVAEVIDTAEELKAAVGAANKESGAV